MEDRAVRGIQTVIRYIESRLGGRLELETVAEATAKAILLSYPMVSQVDLTIKKPWAPIGLPLDTVSVEISRGWHTAYIALGSNMGDKEKYLNEAVEKLQQTSDCQVLKVSDFLVTAPYGGVEQDDFCSSDDR